MPSFGGGESRYVSTQEALKREEKPQNQKKGEERHEKAGGVYSPGLSNSRGGGTLGATQKGRNLGRLKGCKDSIGK